MSFMLRLIISKGYEKEVKKYILSLNHAYILSKRQCSFKFKTYSRAFEGIDIIGQQNNFREVINFNEDSRIIFSSVVHKHKLRVPHYIGKIINQNVINKIRRHDYRYSVPLVVERLKENTLNTHSVAENIPQEVKKESSTFQFPFSKFEKISIEEKISETKKNTMEDDFSKETYTVKEDIAVRLKTYNEKIGKENFLQVTKSQDEEHVRIYKDTLLSDLAQEVNDNSVAVTRYGTSNPNVPKSSVPCGGCGAFLHCQDESLPGYVPSELICGKDKGELRSLDCQRCLFLKRYNTALKIRVSPDVYEQALLPVVQSTSMVLVVIDLMDVPCSIWPGLFDLIGTRRPVVVVGNKVDLLPLDSKDYLKTIKESFVSAVKKTNLWRANIRHISLISAKTGYGVESLISHIQINWGIKGDIYIIGCTNTGKSSLFNALLGSDLCKVAALDLIKRATPSPWPGTTLNLLKFPLLRPSGKRLFDRKWRLEKEAEKKLQESLNPKKLPNSNSFIPTLTGHIGLTFKPSAIKEEPFDPFHVAANRIPADIKPVMGVDENKKDYSFGKWCYDTPGTVQPDQCLGLLTHEELLDVLPKTTIKPRIFALSSSQSLFIAGLARLDVLYTPKGIRAIVCCCSNLPITLVSTSDAASVYRDYLGSNLMRVPRGGDRRLIHWPALKPTNVRLVGKGKTETAGDVVLSSAGFITISATHQEDIELRGWTPGGRGVYRRVPSMIPRGRNFIGKRERNSHFVYSRQPSFDY